MTRSHNATTGDLGVNDIEVEGREQDEVSIHS